MSVLNTILRHHAARKGCLLVGQTYFYDEPRNFTKLVDGIFICRGFYSSFQAPQGGLSLNFGVHNTKIIQPGPVIDFLIANQNVRDYYQIDWNKAKRKLKNLKIKVATPNEEYKITGLSEKSCKEQMFLLNRQGNDALGVKPQFMIILLSIGVVLNYSADFPCINVGKSNKRTYFPLEICSLLSLQRYTKALSIHQRSSMVEKSRLRPQEMVKILTDTFASNNYISDPIMHSCGLSINNHFTQVEGRVLSTPRLRFRDGKDIIPQNGTWSCKNKFFEPARIKHWL
ncbi:Argonaute family protein [Quillaja saponaria]|uniref:Argonaute family protein n=1 Tax=Quillaja saponaria TaxID=32244 RepID=A0AAD7VI32_QUISA|nr:Argonaute family protein [Quillaja saponaria]